MVLTNKSNGTDTVAAGQCWCGYMQYTGSCDYELFQHEAFMFPQATSHSSSDHRKYEFTNDTLSESG